MSEMNAVSRFFVNLSAARRASRVTGWIRAEVPIPPGARCLEIGCGNAALGVRLIDTFHPSLYVATDFDPRQIREAGRLVQRRYSGNPPAALVLRTADMLRLDEPSDAYDIVLAMVSLHHASPTHGDFHRVPQALSEIRRVLRPGGRLVYEEFLHKDAIRHWLLEHGFEIDRERQRWRLETVAARKLPGTAPVGSSG
jgi:SAM-dependent methyltransferase